MHLKEIVARVVFLRLIYVIVCSIVSVTIENIKIKTIFNNRTKVNYMFKRLVDIASLSVRQDINIIIINIINKRAHFFDICEVVLISIDSITISISIFVVKCSDHELLLKRFFQCAVRMSFIT